MLKMFAGYFNHLQSLAAVDDRVRGVEMEGPN